MSANFCELMDARKMEIVGKSGGINKLKLTAFGELNW